ncbi:hypothetical protein PsYK624_157420 [Phanerochaete sordida]|uniref:F-box domain-containing protein n=1 Tax=Phanerochaete sordida TaxID=48140 RepID=A0A9P3LLA1_9APHY|nr:hypothetical protein PsYK624_157420 [Phanerochaete sordida]
MPLDRPHPLNSRPGASRLPQELLDSVIGELRDDKGALKRCSLVASNWLPASSTLLLRRVLWPPCARKIDVCKTPLPNEAPPTCKYIPTSQNSFALCLEILASSPRLQRSVRKLVCMPPNKMHDMKDDTRGALELQTFVDIVNRLPHLELVNLLGVVLQSGDSPSTEGNGRTLEMFHAFGESIDHSEALFSFLSTFQHVKHLSFFVYGLFPQGWSTELSASRPTVEVLEFKHTQDPQGPWVASSPLSFYAGLARNLDLHTLRRLDADSLQPGSSIIFSAAPALESLSLSANNRELSLDFERIPPRLANVEVSCMFLVHNGRIGPPGASGVWTRVWTTFRAAALLPIRKIVVRFNVMFVKTSQEDLYAEYEAILSQITEWQTAASVLDELVRLESITVELDTTLLQAGAPMASIHIHDRYVAALRDAIAKGLPRRYVDILHVKAAASKPEV